MNHPFSYNNMLLIINRSMLTAKRKFVKDFETHLCPAAPHQHGTHVKRRAKPPTSQKLKNTISEHIVMTYLSLNYNHFTIHTRCRYQMKADQVKSMSIRNRSKILAYPFGCMRRRDRMGGAALANGGLVV